MTVVTGTLGAAGSLLLVAGGVVYLADIARPWPGARLVMAGAATAGWVCWILADALRGRIGWTLADTAAAAWYAREWHRAFLAATARRTPNPGLGGTR